VTAVVVRGERTTVRPATEGDVERLVRWHADPDVARYWDDETYSAEEVRGRLARADVTTYIVEESGEPVGLLEAWRDPDGTAGLDMFLVPEARGRGLGPDAARALAQHLLEREGWQTLTVDPYLWNEPAIRAWRRAGFEPVEEREPDEWRTARWLLMEFRG
jgi:aminoglycoside 6'-N-acetyltransferase